MELAPRNPLLNATVAEAAAHLRMTERVFRSLVKREIITAASGRGYVLETVRNEYFDYMRAYIKKREKDRPLDPVQELARKHAETADRVALQNAETRAELVPTAELQSVLGQFYEHARNKLVALCDDLAARLDGRTMLERETILRDAIYGALAKLSQEKFTNELPASH